jgi:transposase
MKRFIQGEHRGQGTLLPESLDDCFSDTTPVRVVDVFVDELDLVNLDFESAIPADTGRPAYHPAILLKIYIYGYLNRIQSSRRLEREAQRNVALMWLPEDTTSNMNILVASKVPAFSGELRGEDRR